MRYLLQVLYTKHISIKPMRACHDLYLNFFFTHSGCATETFFHDDKK